MYYFLFFFIFKSSCLLNKQEFRRTRNGIQNTLGGLLTGSAFDRLFPTVGIQQLRRRWAPYLSVDWSNSKLFESRPLLSSALDSLLRLPCVMIGRERRKIRTFSINRKYRIGSAWPYRNAHHIWHVLDADDDIVCEHWDQTLHLGKRTRQPSSVSLHHPGNSIPHRQDPDSVRNFTAK